MWGRENKDRHPGASELLRRLKISEGFTASVVKLPPELSPEESGLFEYGVSIGQEGQPLEDTVILVPSSAGCGVIGFQQSWKQGTEIPYPVRVSLHELRQSFITEPFSPEHVEYCNRFYGRMAPFLRGLIAMRRS